MNQTIKLPEGWALSLGTAAAVGSLAGAIWWAAYQPHVHSLPVLLALHCGGLVAWQAALGLLGSRWRTPLVPAMAGLLGLVLAPMGLQPLHDAGFLAGKAGAVMDLAVMLSAMVLGSLSGWLMTARSILLAAAVEAVVLPAVVAPMVLFPHVAYQPATAATINPEFRPPHPVLVYGIDGGDWRVLDEMMSQGELPNLQALRERGQHGVLTSLEDMMASPVVWTSIFTGQDRFTTGVEDWYSGDARNRKVPAGWDIVAANGGHPLIANVPGSWPPNEVPGGTMIVGFPMPGLQAGDTGHLRGKVLTSRADSEGYLQTVRLDAEGRATVQVGTPELPEEGLRHPLLDALGREGLLPMHAFELTLQIEARDGEVQVTGFDQGPVVVQEGAWSPWMKLSYAQDGGLEGYTRLYLLEADPSGATLYMAPSFQDPQAPRVPYTDLEDLGAMGGPIPYIVEPVGWTAHRDERVAPIIPDLLLEASDRHMQAVRELYDPAQHDFVGVVYTATDRLQHSYWALVDPQAFTDHWRAPEGLSGMDPVAAAYRQADHHLGELLALMPEETLVFVVSDHGLGTDDPTFLDQLHFGETGHRKQGMWIAAGGYVRPAGATRELGVVDVLPTVFACTNRPVAQDMDGEPYEALCGGAAEVIPTYLGSAGVTVGGSTMEQIQTLGYMDDGQQEGD